MTGVILFVALLASPAGAQPPRAALSVAVQYVRYAGDCAKTVAIEHSQSFPVPVKTDKGLRYLVMFYPAWSSDGAAALNKDAYPPSAVARFDGDGGEVTCRAPVSLPKASFLKPLGPQLSPEAAKMTYDEYSERSERLFAALERAAGAFVAGKRDAPAREAAAEFQALFAALAEPGLKAHYRALSPDFWAWLEAPEKKD